MRITRRKLAGSIMTLVCTAVLATTASAAATRPRSELPDAPNARRPERSATRTTSLEWMADVHERLRTLEDHAAEAARQSQRFTFYTDLLGRLHPQLPAAGDGAQP